MPCKDYRSTGWITYFILFGIFWLGTVGCNPTDLTATPIPTSERLLTPYITATFGPTPHLEPASQGVTPTVTEIPLPTATAVIYAVVANDTLTGIASRYSVPLEDLIAANPGLDPNFLTIGMTLTIPLEGVVVSALPTATPIPLEIQAPICYSLADGNLQCLAVIENTLPDAVENVTAQISLQAPNGEILATKVATSPLNILPVGKKAALSATFDGLAAQSYRPLASLLTVIPVAQDDQRYLRTELRSSAPVISPDGLQAQVQGSVALLAEQPGAATVWIAVFAYDEDENIIGFRKWVASDVLLAGEQIDFEMQVYSLGPPITHLELLAEARP